MNLDFYHPQGVSDHRPTLATPDNRPLDNSSGYPGRSNGQRGLLRRARLCVWFGAVVGHADTHILLVGTSRGFENKRSSPKL